MKIEASTFSNASQSTPGRCGHPYFFLFQITDRPTFLASLLVATLAVKCCKACECFIFEKEGFTIDCTLTVHTIPSLALHTVSSSLPKTQCSSNSQSMQRALSFLHSTLSGQCSDGFSRREWSLFLDPVRTERPASLCGFVADVTLSTGVFVPEDEKSAKVDVRGVKLVRETKNFQILRADSMRGGGRGLSTSSFQRRDCHIHAK